MNKYQRALITKILTIIISVALTFTISADEIEKSSATEELKTLMKAVSGDSPLIADLQSLADEIGGRLTGSEANKRSIEWALQRFKKAGVKSRKEAFEMPHHWEELKTKATISGDVDYTARVVSKPYSGSTPSSGLEAVLVDGGNGLDEAVKSLGNKAKGAWVLVETPVLDDVVGLGGLFKEYNDAVPIEENLIKSGALGIIFMSSRPKNLLYRHNASRGIDTPLPILVMEREAAKRSLRLLREGKTLSFNGVVQTKTNKNYESHNVIGEIEGSDLKDEIVVFGAHLDSHDLGTGALDNGSNVTMLINIARQINKLGMKPRRTIRFGLWNGEEQGFYGSRGYTRTHENELDKHRLAVSFDIGTGRINGFFTGGRPEVKNAVDAAMAPISNLGPFTQVDVPIVGTDNFDFMLEGVPNLVASQEDANYSSNYHARSDTFDKVDQEQLKKNSAIAAALMWHFANADNLPGRQNLEELQNIFDTTNLADQMKSMNVMDAWNNNELGLGRQRKN